MVNPCCERAFAGCSECTGAICLEHAEAKLCLICQTWQCSELCRDNHENRCGLLGFPKEKNPRWP